MPSKTPTNITSTLPMLPPMLNLINLRKLS